MSENKLSYLKPLILSGAVTVFGELFLHASLKDIAEAMGCGPDHVNTLRKNPLKVTMGDIAKLSEAIGMKGWVRVAGLFFCD